MTGAPRRGVGGVALGLIALSSCHWRPLAPADAESRLRAQLQAISQLREVLPGGEALELHQLRFTEVVISLHGDVAEVLANAGASGSFGEASLQYTGTERLLLHREGDGYVGPLVPSLTGVLEALARRQRAIATEDRVAILDLAASDYRDGSVDRARLAPLFSTLWPTVERAQPNALAVRVDHDRAAVSLRFEGDGGSRTHTLALERDVKLWRYSAGLL